MIKNKVLTPVLAGVLGVSVVGSGVGYYLVNKDSDKAVKPEQTMDTMKMSLTQVEQTMTDNVTDVEKAVKGELDYAYDSSLKITFGEGITTVGKNAGAKQSVKPVQIDTKVKQKGQNSQVDIVAKYNDANLISLETIYARDKNAAYFRIPELSSAYITATEADLKKTFEDYAKKVQSRTGTSSAQTDLNISKDLDLKNFGIKTPELKSIDSAKLEKSLKEYYELFKSKLPAKKDNGTVSGDINGNAYNYKVVTYTITGKQMQDALNAVLDKMAGDADLKKLFDDQMAASKAAASSKIKSYADFIAQLKKETAINSENANKTAAIDVYYDGEEIVGGAVKYDNKSIAKAVLINKDTINAIDVVISDNDGKELFKANGASKLTDGTISGTYTISANAANKTALNGTITLDKVVLKDDYFNGTVAISFNAPGKTGGAQSFGTKITGNCTKDKKDIKFTIDTNGKNLMTVDFKQNKTEATDVALPTEKVFTTSQLDQYKATCDIEGFKENINNALGTNVFSLFDNFGKLGKSASQKAASSTTQGTTQVDMSDLYDMYSF
ncbi:MAG: hypothetical protein K6F27_05260 [Ruminococcus sp.]|nr:hypothetical protein [Ruminococcus sp.]